ncbi:MAG: LPS export ABC transporter periplasmic protein LptC [Cloacibacillus sp.]
MQKKISKTKIILLTVVAVTAVGVFYMWRDLNLDSIKKVPIPDVVVENLDLNRVIKGDTWKFRSPRVEHKEGMVYGDSMDVTITSPNGRVSHITAEKGVFSRANNDLTLKNAVGRMQEKDKVYDLKSGNVFYEAAKENWHFSDGIELIIGKIKVSGKNGTYDTKSGDCKITNGGLITWSD